MKYLVILKRSEKYGGDIRLGFHSDSHPSAMIPKKCSSIRHILWKYSTAQLIELINKMRSGSAAFKFEFLSQVISGGTLVKFDTGETAAVEFTLLPSNSRFRCSTEKNYFREITVHQIKTGEGFENAPVQYFEPKPKAESTTPNFETGGVSCIIDISDPYREICMKSSGEDDLSWSRVAAQASFKNVIPNTAHVNGKGSCFDILQSKPQQSTNGNGISTGFGTSSNGTPQDLQVTSRRPIGLDLPNSTTNSEIQAMNTQIIEKQLAIRQLELEYENEQNIRAANNKQLELRIKSEELDCRKEEMKLKMQENAIKFIDSLIEQGIPACEVKTLLERVHC